MNLQTVTYNNISFVNINNPGELELKHLSMNYGFNTLDLEDFTNKTQIPKIETFKKYTLIVLDFPVFSSPKTSPPTPKKISSFFKHPQEAFSSLPLPYLTIHKKRKIVTSQVYFFIGKDYVVVLHDNLLAPINDIFAQCQKSLRNRNDLMSQGSVFLAYRIIDTLVDNCFPVMNELATKIELVDRYIEEEKSQTELLDEISITRRNIVYFQTMIKPVLPLFRQLEEGKYKELNGSLQQYWSNILDHLQKLWNRLEDGRELIEGISGSYESLLSTKTNDIVKVLTIFSAIILPLNLFASLYGMNVHLPFATDPNIFWIILLTMLITSVVMIAIFKLRRWF